MYSARDGAGVTPAKGRILHPDRGCPCETDAPARPSPTRIPLDRENHREGNERMNQSTEKSIQRHERNLRRRAGEFNAGPRRAHARAVRIKLGLHPDWGLIGPFQHGEHRNWVRKRRRDVIRAKSKARATGCTSAGGPSPREPGQPMWKPNAGRSGGTGFPAAEVRADRRECLETSRHLRQR